MPVAHRLAIVVLLMTACFSPAQDAPRTVPAGIPKWKIGGTVVHSRTNQPLPGIEVSIAATEQRNVSVQAVTDNGGRFVFENVARGKYSLVAHGRGFTFQAYQQHGSFSTAVAVGPGLNSENLVFRLVPDGSISGSVLDEENEAVRTGQVYLFRRSKETGVPELQSEATLDEQGRYHFAHLLPGTYLVAVMAQPWYAQPPQLLTKQPLPSTEEPAGGDATVAAPPDFPTSSALDVTYPVTYYPGVTEAGNAAPIVLGAGERTSADVTLRAVSALHLTIRNASADPTRPTSAVLMQRIFEDANSPPMPLQARVQPVNAGMINISGLAPGHLLLSLRTFNGKEWAGENRELDLASDTEIEASDNSVGPLTVEGLIQSPDGAPLPPTTSIMFRNRKMAENFSVGIFPNGTFQLQQALGGPSTFEVAVLNAGDARVREITATGATVSGHSVHLPRTGTVQLKVILSKGLARIDGTVLDKDKPVSEAMVLLVPDSPEKNQDLFRRDQSDSDGTFSLYQIVPGRYTLVAIQNAWDMDWKDLSVLQTYLEHGQTVEITTPRTYKLSVSPQIYKTDAPKSQP
jgi:Carboxypeptidase regulatory-like domain